MIKAAACARWPTTQGADKSLPGVAPVAETVKGFDLTSWNGILGPAGMPRQIVDRLDAEVRQVLADKEVQDQLAQLGFEVWPSSGPDDFARYVSAASSRTGRR